MYNTLFKLKLLNNMLQWFVLDSKESLFKVTYSKVKTAVKTAGLKTYFAYWIERSIFVDIVKEKIHGSSSRSKLLIIEMLYLQKSSLILHSH